MIRRRMILIVAVVVASFANLSLAVVSYISPTRTDGTQAFGGSLGMDFNVNADIEIERLGIFDDDANGLSTPITAHIYDRTNTAAPIATLTFSPGDEGQLVNGSRFKSLASPLLLSAGFQGTIVAEGYNAAEENGNLGTGNAVGPTNDGGGLISFVGGGRFGTAGLFPGSGDGGPANRYHAGTFEFKAAGAIVEDVTAYNVDTSNGPVNGTQNFGGALGMDFNVSETISIDQLGVFDSGQNGFSLGTVLTAQLFDRNNPGAPLATLTFDENDPGVLVNGHRYKDLDQNILLDAGFEGTIVAFGYNANELNGNGGANPAPGFVDSAFGALEFVGSSRFGVTPGLFPGSADGGPANRYLAGTFRFSAHAVPEPTTGLLLLLGGAAAVRRRRRAA